MGAEEQTDVKRKPNQSCRMEPNLRSWKFREKMVLMLKTCREDTPHGEVRSEPADVGFTVHCSFSAYRLLLVKMAVSSRINPVIHYPSALQRQQKGYEAIESTSNPDCKNIQKIKQCKQQRRDSGIITIRRGYVTIQNY
jgi:hypothetical protein